MSKTLSVSAIQNGTVIDHIKSGNALRIISLLGLLKQGNRVTIGLNLPSKRIGKKDLIKIEELALSPEQANELVIFAPQVTINIVKNFEVIEKIKTHLPSHINDVFICPNVLCISQEKHLETKFYIEEHGKQVNVTCHYCERTFDRDQLKVKI